MTSPSTISLMNEEMAIETLVRCMIQEIVNKIAKNNQTMPETLPSMRALCAQLRVGIMNAEKDTIDSIQRSIMVMEWFSDKISAIYTPRANPLRSSMPVKREDKTFISEGSSNTLPKRPQTPGGEVHTSQIDTNDWLRVQKEFYKLYMFYRYLSGEFSNRYELVILILVQKIGFEHTRHCFSYMNCFTSLSKIERQSSILLYLMYRNILIHFMRCILSKLTCYHIVSMGNLETIASFWLDSVKSGSYAENMLLQDDEYSVPYCVRFILFILEDAGVEIENTRNILETILWIEIPFSQWPTEKLLFTLPASVHSLLELSSQHSPTEPEFYLLTNLTSHLIYGINSVAKSTNSRSAF